MGFKQFLVGATSLLGAVSAQHVIFTSGGHGLAVNVPADTASSGNGPIYMQISAPSGTQWVGVGQGSRMAGANMFVVYSRDSTNVTVSPRSGKGEFMPLFDSSAQITVLEGSGIAGDGSMVANIRCDSCLGGTMSATSSSSNWIMAYKQGDALDTDDTSATISQHDSDTGFTLDLTQGTGGSSSNPFVQQSSSPEASGTASSNPTATGTATGTTQTAATGTNGVSTPIASNSSNDGSASRVVSDPNDAIRSSHGIIMSILFVGCFPLFSLTLYLPWAIKVRFIHAPLQILSLVLLIVGMALGIVLGNKISELDDYHMVIGFIVVAGMVLAQPAMGVYQHMYYHKTGGKSAFGIAHRWLGRTLIALGIVNGGIGFMISGETSAYTPYAIVAAIVFLIYLLVLGFAWFKSRKNMSVDNEKAPSNRSNYEMQPPRQAPHSRLPSDDHKNAYQQQNKMNATYTMNART